MKPTTLDEAIQELMKSNIPADKIDGRWIRNEWGLWAGGSLAQWFWNIEIYHADDMSGIIIDSYDRIVKGEPIDLPGQVQVYHKHWENEWGLNHKEKMIEYLPDWCQKIILRDKKIDKIVE